MESVSSKALELDEVSPLVPCKQPDGLRQALAPKDFLLLTLIWIRSNTANLATRPTRRPIIRLSAADLVPGFRPLLPHRTSPIGSILAPGYRVNSNPNASLSMEAGELRDYVAGLAVRRGQHPKGKRLDRVWPPRVG